jgi:hypothetical protein
VRDAEDLASKMIAMVDMGERDCAAMGTAGRTKMERQFDEGIVVDAYLQVLRSILCALPNESPNVERVPTA